MESEVEKICQLIFADDNNTQIAVQLLKGNRNLNQQLEKEFSAPLAILGKKTFKSIFSLLKKQRQNEKMSSKEKLALISHPRLAEGIVELHLADYRLTTLPEAIDNLSSVKLIDLRINKLKTLPANFAHLSTLETVYLSHNHFRTFPELLIHNQNLIELDLTSNKISSITPRIGQLQKLTNLNLAANQLSALPDQITELPYLERLILVENKLKRLPKSLHTLSSLKMLNLGGWKHSFNEIPETLMALSKLEHLIMNSSANIKNLSVIGNCTSLKLLDLGLSKGCHIPTNIGQLQQLIRLSITANNNCSIDYLPESLENLQQLKTLTVWGHKISKSEQKRWAVALPQCQVYFHK
ncbi:MAG: leucine-rich repeat domain-containing protein [Aureispira sp.]